MVTRRTSLDSFEVSEDDIPTLSFEFTELKYDQLPQLNDLVFRSARAIVVGERVYLQDYPHSNHETLWDEEVSDLEPDYDTVDDDGVFVFHITRSGDVVFVQPDITESDNQDFAVMVAFLRQMDVPEDARVRWSHGNSAIKSEVREFYDLIR